MATVIIAAIIGILVAVIIVKEIKNRKAGKCSCGCNECVLKEKCGK